MATAVSQSGLITGRYMRLLRRQPAYVVFTLVQPLVWLLLFSQLFTSVAELPGFEGETYITYLTPGIVVMTSVMTATWAGTSFIDDMQRGVMDRMLTSPLHRSALVVGNLAYHAVITAAQSLLVLAVGWLLGARFEGGIGGIAMVVVLAVLLSISFVAMSCGMALAIRSQDALIGMSQVLVLPLVFLSSLLMPADLLPDWMQSVARFNPIDWAAVASREALGLHPDWATLGWLTALLAALGLVMSVLAVRSFGTYRRNV